MFHKRQKSHSPSDENQTWCRDAALTLLQTIPRDQKFNWSQSVSSLGIPGDNRGQVLKEYAVRTGIDVVKLEQRDVPLTPRVRRAKKKLPWKEISTPSLPTPKAVKAEKQNLIATGQLSIGEPCSPYTIKKSVVTVDGVIQTTSVELTGRKVPLTQVRNTLFKKHKEYMRLNTDNEISKFTKDEILKLMSIAHHEISPDCSLEQLQVELATMQRTRNFAL